MRIGMIGAGKIGRTLGGLMEGAGHDVFYGVRTPDGTDRAIGTVGEAARFGELIVFAAPFGAWADFVSHNYPASAGKVVIDASNPVVSRDGDVARLVAESQAGSAVYVAGLVPESHLAKTFNTVYWVDLKEQAGRAGARLGMPIVTDSKLADEVLQTLVSEVGFEPVLVGGLDRASDLDPGSPIYAKSYTAREIRAVLELEA